MWKGEKMRTQAGLEFMLILAMVALLGLAALMLYSRNIGSLDSAKTPLAFNASVNVTGVQQVQMPYIWAYVPLNSTLNSENKMQIDLAGCTNGTADISLASASMAFSASLLRDIAVNGIKSIGIGFEPFAAGMNNISMNYTVICEGSERHGVSIFGTFAMPADGAGAASGAYIKRIYERVDFAAHGSNIMTTDEWSHCTKVNYWTGIPLGIGAQCGTGDGWDFMTFDAGCLAPYWSYSDTHCVVPVDTGRAYIEQGSGHAAYAIEAYAYTGTGTLNSTLSSASNASLVYLNGRDAGNASVMSAAYAVQNYQPFLINGSRYGTASDDALSAYIQSRNNLYSMLKYYNLTGISGDTATSIEEARSTFGREAYALIGSFSGLGSGCTAENGSAVCDAFSPFTYDIAMRMNASQGIGNASFYYEGSDIRVST